ncbi:GntR family transcriptional regulator [Erysipelotrichaceae bacterium OttesenSCG-928-M19]|nr:GntR family transcriptional regulator [Erysipelotrichaceae bacterium OttesenSCG-928-M19]
MKTTLADQIYEYLKKDIILGKYQHGQKITIKEIEDEFNVSSTPVREALAKLNGDNLVEITTNQGANVIEYTLENSMDVHELSSLLDSYALGYAMDHGNREELVTKLEKTFEISKTKHREGEIQELYYKNYFHDVFYEFVDNKIIIELKERYKAAFSMVVLKAHIDDEFHRAQQDHRDVLEAIKNDDKELALKLFQKHFNLGKDRLLKYYSADKEK